MKPFIYHLLTVFVNLFLQDSFVLYRLFNRQDEETLAPISEPPSTSPPANPPLQQADDMASASMVEDKASPSDSSQLTPTNVTNGHSSTAHLLAAAGAAEQTADQVNCLFSLSCIIISSACSCLSVD
jgi:hypothetical protein